MSMDNRWRSRATYIVRTFRTDDAENSSATQTITVGTPQLYEFTFVTDYTVECSTRCPWTTPRRLTTAAVTIEGPARRPLAMLRATTPSFARSATDDAETALRPPTITVRTSPLLGSPEALPTTIGVRRDAVDDAGVRQLQRVTMKCHENRWRCAGSYTIVRTFTATDDAETALRPATIGTGHHGSGVHLRPADYTVKCSTRCPWTTPRRPTTAAR